METSYVYLKICASGTPTFMYRSQYSLFHCSWLRGGSEGPADPN